ncbi:hypothetical protein Syun_020086 [Stephania yunnanensis]|uniref:Uncharacterized protein n=1 Tax=Stephania yunnanensis TaxID=152371 RepID=A0AAP0NPB7_9MAGN
MDAVEGMGPLPDSLQQYGWSINIKWCNEKIWHWAVEIGPESFNLTFLNKTSLSVRSFQALFAWLRCRVFLTLLPIAKFGYLLAFLKLNSDLVWEKGLSIARAGGLGGSRSWLGQGLGWWPGSGLGARARGLGLWGFLGSGLGSGGSGFVASWFRGFRAVALGLRVWLGLGLSGSGLAQGSWASVAWGSVASGWPGLCGLSGSVAWWLRALWLRALWLVAQASGLGACVGLVALWLRACGGSVAQSGSVAQWPGLWPVPGPVACGSVAQWPQAQWLSGQGSVAQWLRLRLSGLGLGPSGHGLSGLSGSVASVALQLAGHGYGHGSVALAGAGRPCGLSGLRPVACGSGPGPVAQWPVAGLRPGLSGSGPVASGPSGSVASGSGLAQWPVAQGLGSGPQWLSGLGSVASVALWPQWAQWPQWPRAQWLSGQWLSGQWLSGSGQAQWLSGSGSGLAQQPGLAWWLRAQWSAVAQWLVGLSGQGQWLMASAALQVRQWLSGWQGGQGLAGRLAQGLHGLVVMASVVMAQGSVARASGPGLAA